MSTVPPERRTTMPRFTGSLEHGPMTAAGDPIPRSQPRTEATGRRTDDDIRRAKGEASAVREPPRSEASSVREQQQIAELAFARALHAIEYEIRERTNAEVRDAIDRKRIEQAEDTAAKSMALASTATGQVRRERAKLYAALAALVTAITALVWREVATPRAPAPVEVREPTRDERIEQLLQELERGH